jgi:hypothetical protein
VRARLPALALALAVIVPAACAGPAPATPVPTANSTATETAADAQPALLANPWMPPWTGPNVAPEIAERAGHRFCGVEHGPPIDRAIRACFVNEVTAGREIEFARIEPTIEGDPIATVFGFEPEGGFSTAVDSTQDRFGAPGWSVFFCTRIVPDPDAVFVMDGCVAGPVFH